MNWKLQDKKKDPDEGYASEEYTAEEHKNRLTQKQLKAETKRKELEALKQDSLQKEFNKINEARENKEKLAKEQSKKLEAFSKKLSEAESVKTTFIELRGIIFSERGMKRKLVRRREKPRMKLIKLMKWLSSDCLKNKQRS